MKVLHVNAKAGFFGGVERILFDTATGLRERGWHQYLLHTGENEGEDFRAPFTRVMTDLDEALTLQPDVALIHKEADPRRIATLAKAVPTVRMVHDHDLVCLRRHKYFPRNTRICTLPAGMNCYTNGCFIQRSSPGSLLPITFKGLGGIVQGLAAHEQVRHFIAISRFMREELEMNGIPAERIELIHPIPRALDSVKAVSPPPTDGAAEILFVGQVIRGKGADLMIRALAHLQDDWHATIVGDGHHLGACRDLARELGIAERIEFTGWVDHEALGRFYERAL
ncbi:MAG: glycosyltransferase, partial [Gammaproteobacteria bacterium]